MCEITNGKIYVADRDLVCYKIMVERDGQLTSLHNRYEYEIGREYCVRGFEYRCLGDDVIYEGWEKPLSSFDGWSKCYSMWSNMCKSAIETDLCYTRNGFYSYTYYGNGRMEFDSDLATTCYGLSGRIKIVRCRIPEGGKYVVSDSGEVFISERIVIDDAWSLFNLIIWKTTR